MQKSAWHGGSWDIPEGRRKNFQCKPFKNLWARFQATQSLSDRLRSGQSSVTDYRQTATLLHAFDEPFPHCFRYSMDSNGRRGHVSERTICRRLSNADLSCRQQYVEAILTRECQQNSSMGLVWTIQLYNYNFDRRKTKIGSAFCILLVYVCVCEREMGWMGGRDKC